MKISIIHPTRHRRKMAIATRMNWLMKADGDVEYLLSIDSDDQTMPPFVKGIRGPNKTAIEAINRAAKEATGDLLVVVSDDFGCDMHWDTLLKMEIEGREDFLVKTRDGIQPVLVTLPIMDRAYYNRFGYVYHPDYYHMGCDVELTAVAIMTGKLIYSDLLFPHLHYSTGLTPKDEINEKNDKTYAQGDEVLARHRENNFGIKHPVCTYESIIWHPQ